MITVITPTCDRPQAIVLCERWMARQTVQPDQWIVADGGSTPATLTMGQEHIHTPGQSGACNFATNVRNGLAAAHGDVILIMEDDDYYRADHVEHCVAGVEAGGVYGCPWLRYYHVGARRYITLRNIGAALCQTAFNRDHLGRMRDAANAALAAGDYRIDGRFWNRMRDRATGEATSVGIKGLPGTVGLGVGHRPRSPRIAWRDDVDGRVLREWLGEDAAQYEALPLAA